LTRSPKGPPDLPVSRGIAPDTSEPTRDLTDLQASFRILFMRNPQPMWVYNLKTLQLIEVNDAAVRHYGYSRDEFLQLLISDIRPLDEVPRSLEEEAEARVRLQHRGEWRHRVKDGRIIEVEIDSHNLEFGKHEAQLVVVRDITKQKAAEQALKQAERKYRLIFEEAIVGIYQSTPDGRLLSANPAMAQMLGFDSPEELMTCITDIPHQLYVDPERWEEFKRLMRERGVVRHFDLQVHRKDRSEMWLWTNARAVHEGGTIVRYDGTFEDITDRKIMEDQLRHAKHQYRDIVENAVVGIFQSTPRGRYLSVNPAMAHMMGYASPQELLTSITNIGTQVYVDPNRREELKTLASEHGMARNFECQLYRKDGSKMWISANVRAIFEGGAVSRFEGMNEDITQRKLLEGQLLQAQKMEAVGQLAGGVAHDFNNALSVITGYSDLLQMNLTTEDLSHSYAVEIAKASRRAAALTRQLLAFSRKQVIQPVVLDLNTTTRELEKMIGRLIGENIEVTFKRGAGLGRVKMDPGQVEQILMNLAINARDAMPQGGRLCIETANVELDETYARQNAYVRPGSYVMLTVSDTGCGMDRETQLHAFEPFFTTKEPDKGTGLGLSTVYGIAKQNGGYIVVYSELGKGTTFRLYVPRLGRDIKLPLPPNALDAIPCGTETILVVEDEESLRSLVRTCLESNGYSVLNAPNSAVALELVRNHPGRIHLLLTDVVMPGIGGLDLAKRVVVLHPEVKVVFMSGYANDLVDEQGSLDRDTVLLEKPFTLHALLSKVYKALHDARSGHAAAAN
jgi:two-component system cell cycle sensor histidine kinase/response regulator CckA